MKNKLMNLHIFDEGGTGGDGGTGNPNGNGGTGSSCFRTEGCGSEM